MHRTLLLLSLHVQKTPSSIPLKRNHPDLLSNYGARSERAEKSQLLCDLLEIEHYQDSTTKFRTVLCRTPSRVLPRMVAATQYGRKARTGSHRGRLGTTCTGLHWYSRRRHLNRSSAGTPKGGFLAVWRHVADFARSLFHRSSVYGRYTTLPRQRVQTTPWRLRSAVATQQLCSHFMMYRGGVNWRSWHRRPEQPISSALARHTASWRWSCPTRAWAISCKMVSLISSSEARFANSYDSEITCVAY